MLLFWSLQWLFSLWVNRKREFNFFTTYSTVNKFTSYNVPFILFATVNLYVIKIINKHLLTLVVKLKSDWTARLQEYKQIGRWTLELIRGFTKNSIDLCSSWTFALVLNFILNEYSFNKHMCLKRVKFKIQKQTSVIVNLLRWAYGAWVGLHRFP